MFSLCSLTLILLSVITSKTIGEIQASPFKNSTCNSMLDLRLLCPKATWVANLESNYSNSDLNFKCMPNSEKCHAKTKTRILGIGSSELPWLEEPIKDCQNYYLISGNSLNLSTQHVQNCPPTIGKFIQVAFEQTSGTQCALAIQQYRLSDQESCSFQAEWNTNVLLNSPNCFSYNCSQASSILAKLSGTINEPAELHTEPEIVQAESKQSEVRKSDRPEWVRRIRKPINWSWRDHVLEITIVAIFAAILLLVGLKICLAEKVMDAYHNVRILSCNKPGVKFSRCNLNPNKPRGFVYDLTKHPNKPILKNCPKKPPACDNKLTMSREIRSFESNSSIYYDTLEYPESELQPMDSYAQPLISNF